MSCSLSKVPNVKIDVNKFKYILIKVHSKSSDESKVIVRGDSTKAYHADIYDSEAPGIEKLGLDCEVLGGGRIIHDQSAQTLNVFGYSMGFGRADHSVTAGILQKEYPAYKITTSNEGY